MKALPSLGLAAVVALVLGFAEPRGADCDSAGNIRFICGQVGPEDLAVVPGGEWVISSGNVANGGIRLIKVRDKTSTVLFPTTPSKERPDRKTYGTCPGPIDPAEKANFRAHGLYLRPGKNALHTCIRRGETCCFMAPMDSGSATGLAFGYASRTAGRPSRWSPCGWVM